MTEAEWLATADPAPMVSFLEGRASDRQFRLFACSCCWRIARFLHAPDFARTIEVTEWYVDGQATAEELRRAFKVVEDHVSAQTPEHGVSCVAEFPVLWASATWYKDGRLTTEAVQSCSRGTRDALERYDPDHLSRLAEGPPAPEIRELGYPFTSEELNEFVRRSEERGAFEQAERQHLQSQEAARQAALLRDIFGNPFRPVTFYPEWRTDTAVALARQMYESRDFSAMPILADALQDAGCDNDEVLNHCRSESVHIRGCWVADLVLGNE